MRRTFTTAVTIALMAAGLAQAADKVRIGVEGNYPPFSQVAADGALSGFDIDIANAVCAKLKSECVFVQQEFDGMIPALNARKFDMIVASMTITEERLKAVDFSDSYYNVPSRFVAKAGAFKDHKAETLKDKTIIVLRNSPRAKYLADNYPNSKIHLAARETDVYLELVAGRGDIALGSSVVSGEAFLKKPEGKGFEQVGPAFQLTQGAGGVGIATRKGDDLTARINAALREMKADGTYKALQAKYFDFDISGDS
jgi:polar amino acid transport system substrate-binding protein/arginine/ornithine transport system substrate-binding protein